MTYRIVYAKQGEKDERGNRGIERCKIAEELMTRPMTGEA